MPQPSPALVKACRKIVDEIGRLAPGRPSPIVVALDGGSGAGKSSLTAMLERELDAVVVPLDDFFAAEIPDLEWEARSVAERARQVFDWGRLRAEALEPLLAGRTARWRPFDFAARLRPDGTYALSEQFVERQPAPVIVLEGAYSSSPEIADLIDLTVLVDVPIEERHKRLARREDEQFLRRWHAIWDEVEEYYFNRIRPRSSFDLIISGQ